MRVGVLSNPRAGVSGSKIDRISALLAHHPDVLHLQTQDAESVAPALGEMAQRGVEVIVLNGGDGTVQHALTHLLRGSQAGYLPWLAPLRSGRTNTIAGDLGAARNPVRGLGALLDEVASGRVAERIVERPVIRVEIDEGVYYGLFLGFGMLHRAVRLVHEAFPPGRSRGTLGAGVLTASLVLRSALEPQAGGILTPDDIELVLDGEARGRLALRLAMVTTLRRLFFGIEPFWGRENAPLRVSLGEARVQRIGRVAIGILRGRPGPFVRPENGYHSHNVHRLEARLDGGLILDGELFDPCPDRLVRVSASTDVRWLRA